jgi:uncharacterized membrane protein YfhO
MGKYFSRTFGKQSGEKYGLVFGLGFLSLFVVLLPLMILDHGYFIYYGDFVSQQLPFYELANDAVRSGQLGWNWYTDLGGSFIGSYAFYLFGSPFFWLTTVLPRSWVLYAIPWLLCLKHGIAALTAYGYIRRFVQNRNAAVIGGLLYAFSGFQVFNIFFNHFQDVTAFFPLMLIAMEELVNNRRRGWFALSVALMAVINYFFFTGQVVFLILYFLVRLCCHDFQITWKKFWALAIEAVIGVCIACVILFPAALAILGNSRVSQTLLGQDMLFYSDKTRIVRIIQSFFMIPDAPARPNLFSTGSGKWASIGGYLPLFSMAGVIAFMGNKKKHWATKLVGICILCAFVPILNSAFYMFNSSYYARWYYMPILMMAMMTAYALDNAELDWKPGIRICGVMLVAFGVISLLPIRNEEDEAEFFAFSNIPVYFYIVLAVCVLGWFGMRYVCRLRAQKKPFLKKAVALTAAACAVCTATVVYFGKVIGTDGQTYIETAIQGEEHLSISYDTDEDDYFRVDISEGYDNYPMFWGLSSMRAFQSVVSTSIMEFYDSIGITRDVASRAETTSYTLRGLFSVKYYFNKVSEDAEAPDMPGFSYLCTENGFDIYKNDYFIPMGFTYDYYVTEEMLQGRTNATKERILIRALVLSEEQAETYSDIITDASLEDSLTLTDKQYLEECQKHQEEACENFVYDSDGFSASITLSQPKLVFFSVPYDSGWTASVNGSPVTVEKVSSGFMAVRCEAGENTIEFSYETPGLQSGMWISLLGLLMLAVYIGFSRPLFRDSGKKQSHSYDYTPTVGVRAADAYTRSLIHTMQDAGKMKGEAQYGTSERDKS